jgi:DNA primase
MVSASPRTLFPKPHGMADPLPHDEAHRIARRLVSELASQFPDEYILSAQARRRGRIFLDYLRNGRGTTAIGTDSPRAREGAPVTWSRNHRRHHGLRIGRAIAISMWQSTELSA